MPKSYYNAGNPGFKGETFREHLEEGGWVGGWRGKGRLIPKPSPRFFNTISLYNSFSKVSIFGNLGGGVLPRLHGYVFLEKNERGCSEAAPRAVLGVSVGASFNQFFSRISFLNAQAQNHTLGFV